MIFFDTFVLQFSIYFILQSSKVSAELVICMTQSR